MTHDTLDAGPTSGPLTTASPVLWRVAGGLALAHIVLMLAGFSQEVSPMHGDSTARVGELFGDASYTRVMAGGYVEGLGFVVLLPALVFLARHVGRRTEGGRWAAQTGLAAGIGYVAVTMAAGLPAGAAALYAAQHGAGLDTVSAVNDIRNFAFFLSIALAGALALCVGIAALSDGRFRFWLGYGGVATGLICIGGVAADYVNAGSMVWMIWWIGVGVVLLRAPAAAERR